MKQRLTSITAVWLYAFILTTALVVGVIYGCDLQYAAPPR